jgi:hypothetical protein
MIMTTKALLERDPHPSVETICRELSRNLCRCGTHVEIVRAVQRAAELLATQKLVLETADKEASACRDRTSASIDARRRRRANSFTTRRACSSSCGRRKHRFNRRPVSRARGRRSCPLTPTCSSPCATTAA